MTFFKDYSIKTYSETRDGIELLFKQYNKKGEVIHLRYSDGEYFKWKYDAEGNQLYYETNTNPMADFFKYKKTYWVKSEWKLLSLKNKHKTLISQSNSFGIWLKREFNEEGRMTYEETQDGINYSNPKNL